MPHREHIGRLLDDPRIWPLGRGAAAVGRGIPSGWPALDAVLGGGWPIGQLTELLPDAEGIGEFRLLIPALTALSICVSFVHRADVDGIDNHPLRTCRSGRGNASSGVRGERRRDSGSEPRTAPSRGMDAEARFSEKHSPDCFCTTAADERLAGSDPGWIMLVAPPHIPYAPAFEAYGFDLSRLLVVRARRRMDALWAMEQALRSGTCAAVMAWSAVSDGRALRRLQLAAEQGDCWAVLFRPPGMPQAASPAALRVRLSRADGDHELTLHILKQRHGPAVAVRVSI